MFDLNLIEYVKALCVIIWFKWCKKCDDIGYDISFIVGKICSNKYGHKVKSFQLIFKK